MTTQIYIEGNLLDIAEEEMIPLNYSVDDIKNISQVQSPFSKTIKIPGTSNNNKILNFAFSPKVVQTGVESVNNAFGDFDYKRKSRCVILQGNLPVMVGYARLMRAEITDGVVSYELQVISELTSFAAELSDKKLEDIPEEFTNQFDHVLTRAFVSDSWTIHDENPSDESCFYPLADYGIGETCNAQNFYLSYFKPCISARVMLDLLFKANGYTYESSYIDSDRFKRIYFPNTNEFFKGEGYFSQATSDDEVTRLFQTGGFSGGVIGQNIFNEKTVDDTVNPNYDESEKVYTAPLSTYYDVSVGLNNFHFYIKKDSPIALTPYYAIATQRLWVSLVKYNASFSTAEVVYTASREFNRTDGEIFPMNSWFVNRGSYSDYTSQTFSFEVPQQKIFLNEGEHLAATFYLATENPVDKTIYQSIFGNVAGEVNIVLPQGQSMFGVGVSAVLDRALVKYKYWVNKGVKQVDFISSLLRLHNLFPVPDADRPKHFHIYSRDEFYSSGKLVDWTKKLDHSQTVSLVPIPSLDTARLNFSWQYDDKDYWSAKYFSATGKVYGALPLETGYEFNTKTKEVLEKNIFAGTLPVMYSNFNADTGEQSQSEQLFEVRTSTKRRIQLQGYHELSGELPDADKGFTKAKLGVKILYAGEYYTIIHVRNPFVFEVDRDLPGTDASGYWIKNAVFTYYFENNKTIPCIYTSSDNNVTRKAISAKPRLLYYSGLQPCNLFYIQDTPTLVGDEYKYINNSIFAGSKLSYPVLSHLDNNTNPTYDLLFSAPDYVEFPVESYPKYYNQKEDKFIQDFESIYKQWRNSTAEIVDNDAKLFTGYFWLTPLDIATLNLADTVLIDSTYYRINRVVDYIPNYGLTKVELVKKAKQYYDVVPIPPPSPTCQSYSIKNLSSSATSVVRYVSCEGVAVTYNLVPLEFHTLCALQGTIAADAFVQVVELGDCFTGDCITYQIVNPSSEPLIITWQDCFSVGHFVSMPGNEEMIVCAERGSIEWTPGRSLEVLEVGECVPETVMFYVDNDTTGNTIESVSNVPGLTSMLTVGPGDYSGVSRGAVGGTANIAVVVSGSGSRSIQQLVNGTVVSCTSVAGAGTYFLGSRLYAADDEITIRLNDSNVCPVPFTMTSESGSGYTITNITSVPGFTFSGSVVPGDTTITTRERTAGTGSVAVTVSGSGTRSIQLYVNSSVVECKTITGAGTHSFASRSFNAADLIAVIVNDTDECTPPEVNGAVYIENNNSTYNITNVTGIPGYTPNAGYPITPSSGRSGTHNSDFTGTIIVQLPVGATGTGKLIVAGVTRSTVSVSGDKLTFLVAFTPIYRDEMILIQYNN